MPERGSSPEAVVSAFEENFEQNMDIPPFLVNTLIGAYGKLELGHRVLDLVLQETKKGVFRPHKRHLTNLMGALGRSGDLEASIALYHLMSISEADSITLISIIDILSRAYHAELAFQLWRSWRLSNPSLPVLNVYTTLSEAAIKAHRFDIFQQAEMDARMEYHKALASKKLSRIASLQYTPKHCIYLSTLLLRFWIPSLRPIMPQDIRLTLNDTLTTWTKVRTTLPGSPLSSNEISQWESDVDFWISINSSYGPSIDVGQPSEISTPHDEDDSSWFVELEGDDDASIDALILSSKRTPSL